LGRHRLAGALRRYRRSGIAAAPGRIRVSGGRARRGGAASAARGSCAADHERRAGRRRGRGRRRGDGGVLRPARGRTRRRARGAGGEDLDPAVRLRPGRLAGRGCTRAARCDRPAPSRGAGPLRPLTFGFSPCPNDTFAFHALVHGLVEAPFAVEPVLLDIEELNRRAHAGELDLTKLSFGAVGGVGDRYRLLRSGAALGRGVGPLVVAREERPLAGARIAIPGRETTAYLLLRLAEPEAGEVVVLRYDRILGAVAGAEVDAGLIIHESRFTYADHGLVAVADLGSWWEQDT